MGPRHNNNHSAVWRQAGNKRRHGSVVGRGRNNRARTTELLQFLGGVLSGAVDVVMSTEFQGEVSACDSSGNRYNPEAHVTSELNRQVPESADTLNAQQARQRALLTCEGR